MESKKLLVFSDTHGSVKALTAVFNWANDRIPPNDTICAAACLGDSLSDIRRATDSTGFYCDWKIISGNNDYGVTAPETAVFDFADNRFFMCHGHRHGVYSGFYPLIAAAKNAQADIALFGHSHVPFFKNMNGVLLINPGSLGRPRSKIGSTFAVINCIEGKSINVEFMGIDEHGTIKKIKFPA